MSYMSRHDDFVRMGHMLDHAEEAVEMTRGRTRRDLDRNRMLSLALVRLIEIVGEASTRVSDETQRQHPNVPWAEIKGTRNRIVHGYDVVDLDILWDTTELDLPPLIQQLRSILGRT